MILEEWKKNINKLYALNYKAAHFSGSKFNEFYNFISDGEEIHEMPSWLSIINDDVVTHNEIVAKLEPAMEISKEFP